MTAMIKGKDAVGIIKDIKFIPKIGESISFWYKGNIFNNEIKDIVYFVDIDENMHRIEIYI